MRKAFIWSVRAVLFTIPIYPSISIKMLIVSMLVSIVANKLVFDFKTFLLKSWDILLYLLVILIGVFYSEDIKNGFSVLETSFGLLGLSFLFNQLRKFGEIDIKSLVYSFIFGLTIACLICLGNAMINYISSRDFLMFFGYQLTDVINSHPTYLAYYIIASITYVIHRLYYETELKYGIIHYMLTFFLFGILILTGGTTAYISLLLIFSFFILKFILDPDFGAKRMVIIMVFVQLIAIFAINSFNYLENTLGFDNDYWERSALWQSAIQANPNPITGVGTGDYKSVLNAYYDLHGMESFAKGNYNSHNQFVQLYFSNGIIGLSAFLILIGRPLYLSVSVQNTLGVLLMFPFLIYGVTEVFLGRYQGVIFFVLLHQMVVHQYFSSKPTFSLKVA